MNAWKVLVTAPLPERLRSRLESRVQVKARANIAESQFALELADCDALICQLSEMLTASVLQSSPRLKVIANVAVGYDNIDVEVADSASILVANTPGVLDETTADLAFALLLACARRVSESDRFVRAGAWTGWTPDLMLGTDVFGKTLGIVGLGRIGKAVARRAAGFSMPVVYTTGVTDTAGATLPPELSHCRKVGFAQLLSEADFVSINCPLNKKTRHLIAAAELASMKRSAILINTARGAIIDEGALVSALENGIIAGAGLDVFENEPSVPDKLRQMDNVVLTPHTGSATVETRGKMAELAVEAVLAVAEQRLPPNAVNPQVWPRLMQRLV